jgi:hypothetical protein
MPEWWEKASLMLTLVSSSEILVECAAMMKRKIWFAIFCVEFIKYVSPPPPWSHYCTLI